MSIGAPELIIIATFGIVPLVLGIWAVADVLSQPAEVWAATGKDRTAWLVLNILGLLVCFLVPIVYLLTVRPQLRKARSVDPAAPSAPA